VICREGPKQLRKQNVAATAASRAPGSLESARYKSQASPSISIIKATPIAHNPEHSSNLSSSNLPLDHFEMDSFATIFFSKTDEVVAQPPINEEHHGGGSGSYCVVSREVVDQTPAYEENVGGGSHAYCAIA